MEEEYITILKHEFSAEEGSFLLQLRVGYRWDKSAFDHLTEAMYQCCKHYMPDHSTLKMSQPVQATLFPLSETLQREYVQAQHIQAEEMLLPHWLAEDFGMSLHLSQIIPPMQPGKSNLFVNKHISKKPSIVWKVSHTGSSQVDDLAAWQFYLEQHGITVLDSITIADFARFEARDPFGNRFECIQPLE